jgi:type II secretory pathway pseudopilin PulG
MKIETSENLNSGSDSPEGGFGVIESTILLIMIFILGVVVLTAYSAANKAQRDAQRASDVTGLQKALQYYYEEFGEYPQASDDGQAVGVDNSFTRFVSRWPNPPRPADGICTDQTNMYVYEDINNGESYQIKFCLGDDYGNAKGGITVVSPRGVSN